MNDTPQPTASPEQTAAAERFYNAAERRIRSSMLVIAAAATLALTLIYGWRFGLGVAVGCAIAFVNFYWLKRAVKGLADRATQSPAPTSGRLVVVRFLARYALLAVAAYVIFRVSLTSLYGLLCGLFLPVAAIAVEAVYELYVALRRGY